MFLIILGIWKLVWNKGYKAQSSITLDVVPVEEAAFQGLEG
jgi:hypothetical protein